MSRRATCCHQLLAHFSQLVPTRAWAAAQSLWDEWICHSALVAREHCGKSARRTFLIWKPHYDWACFQNYGKRETARWKNSSWKHPQMQNIVCQHGRNELGMRWVLNATSITSEIMMAFVLMRKGVSLVLLMSSGATRKPVFIGEFVLECQNRPLSFIQSHVNLLSLSMTYKE